MSQPTTRRFRDKILFVLAYGAIAAAVLFAHPFDTSTGAQQVATAQAGAGE